jgi:cation diffusion facilitator CzcD-associated flavoprotein CzcO
MSEAKFSNGAATPHIQSQPVSTFNGGTLNSDGYGDVSGFTARGLDYEDLVRTSPVLESHRKQVLIVGAGITGIQQAAVLLDDGYVKHEDIAIIDAQEGYGGVWAKNKYPGCACDVPAIIYTTSFWINKRECPRIHFPISRRCSYPFPYRDIQATLSTLTHELPCFPVYTHFYARRDQIEDYYARFAQAYGLHRCAQFNSLVRACIWDEKELAWHVFVEKKGTGRVTHWMANVICQCVGSLDTPKFGNTPGRETFKGISWHTAHWRDDVDLRDKKVAMIGCGPSAAQIIPEIIDRTGHLTVYMRTPPVCVPRNDYAYSRYVFPFLGDGRGFGDSI